MAEHAVQAPQILMVGLSHKSAPVEVREKLAFSRERTRLVLQDLVGDGSGPVGEAVLLSTCNRTELYVHANDPAAAVEVMQRSLADRSSLSPEHLGSLLTTLRGEEAASHLLRVAAGMESLVLGEPEILGQVRSAAELAHSAGTSGPFLEALFRSAVQAGKVARTETEAGHPSVSVATVVVDLATQVLGDLGDRTALLIGAGKISCLTARSLVKAGLHCVMIANRTYELAQKLAKNLDGIAVHFDALDEFLARADIVICSTGAPHVVLHAETVRKAQQTRAGRPLLVVDLAVPRDADPAIADVPGVHLTDIDDLESVFASRLPAAVSLQRDVEAILQDELEAYFRWYAARRLTPLIEALRQQADEVCRAELEATRRRMGQLTPRQEELLEAMGKAITGKLLHGPMVHLRRLSAADDDSSNSARLVRELYGLK